MGIATFNFTSNFLTSRYHYSFRLLAENLSKNVELDVLLNNRENLQRLVLNMVKQVDVSGVTITSSDGVVLVDQAAIKLNHGVVRVNVPILSPALGDMSYLPGENNELKEIGFVILDYSLKSLNSLKKRMIFRLFVFSLVLSFLSFLCYWFFAKSVSVPIQELILLSQQVSTGNLDVVALGGSRYYETQMLASTFNKMLASLKENQKALESLYEEMAKQKSMAELGKFSMMVAHEIKNPLSIIRGSLDILKKENISPEIRLEMLAYQKEEIDRINRLVEDFLIFAKPLVPDFKLTEMNTFIRNIVYKIAMMWDSDGVILSWEGIDAQDEWLMCDTSLFERALSNIIKNAFESCSPEDKIEISTISENSYWWLMICDSGPGINLKNKEDIFQPFFTNRSRGTGLGLSIVKEIVTIHGGKISAENRDAGGAIFSIALPCHKNI